MMELFFPINLFTIGRWMAKPLDPRKQGLAAVAQEEENPGKDADAELIRDFLEGGQSSFNRLVLKYQNKVFNLCYRMLGERSEAEDVAQEVFMTLFRSVKHFRGDSLFSTWVFRITVNHCKNRLKYLSRRNYFKTQSLDQPFQTEEGEVTPDTEDEGPTPEETLISNEVKEAVQLKIAELDTEHRTAIVLRDIQGLSYQEIAEILGLKEGTVKSRIHRARLELKEKLEREGKL
jgi:RNA polymerase sigma-70 factor (ECF subfamily)